MRERERERARAHTPRWSEEDSDRMFALERPHAFCDFGKLAGSFGKKWY